MENWLFSYERVTESFIHNNTDLFRYKINGLLNSEQHTTFIFTISFYGRNCRVVCKYPVLNYFTAIMIESLNYSLNQFVWAPWFHLFLLGKQSVNIVLKMFISSYWNPAADLWCDCRLACCIEQPRSVFNCSVCSLTELNDYYYYKSSKWMLHTGGGWGETPPHDCKALWVYSNTQ